MDGGGGVGGGGGKKREIGCFSSCCEQPNDLDKEGRNYWQQAKHALGYILTYRLSRKKLLSAPGSQQEDRNFCVRSTPHCGQ